MGTAVCRARIALLMGAILLPGRGVSAAAQEGGAFGVVSEAGRPIVGAPVRLDGAPAAVTDEDGNHSVSLTLGPHRLTVALHGYQTLERSVTAVKDQTATADFPLEPVLQVAVTSLPASLARGAPGLVQLFLTNTAPSTYSLAAAGLSFFDGSRGRR